MNKNSPSPALAVLSVMLLTVILIACQEQPTTPQGPTPTLNPAPTATQTPPPAPMPTLTPVPTATATLAATATRVPAPTATANPAPKPTLGPTATPIPGLALQSFDANMTATTTWGQAFATFTGSEQDCVRDALDESQLDHFLERAITDDSDLPSAFFSCLYPQRAGFLFAGIMALSFEEEMGLDLGDAEVSCLQVWATGKGVPRLLASEDQEADARLLDEISICIAGPLQPLIIAQIKQSVARLASEQEECLVEVMQRYRHLLFRAYVGVWEPEGEEQRMTEELAVCVPELFGDKERDTAEETVRVITPEPQDLLEVHRIEPYLAGNLLFIAHWDEDAQRWLVHDVAGEFTPDQLTPPPGMDIPTDPELGILNGLDRGKLYDFHVRRDQIVNIVEGEMGDWHFNAGANFIEWSR